MLYIALPLIENGSVQILQSVLRSPLVSRRHSDVHLDYGPPREEMWHEQFGLGRTYFVEPERWKRVL